MIPGQRFTLTTTETAMIVLSTQIKPLLERVRAAITGFSQASPVIFVADSPFLSCAKHRVVPVARCAVFVNSTVHSPLFVGWEAVVLAMIASSYFFSIARIGAMLVLIVACAHLADRAMPIRTTRRFMEVDQRLFNATVCAYLPTTQIDRRCLLVQSYQVIGSPSGLLLAHARFAPITVSVASALIFVELVEGLIDAAFRAALEVWYSGHIGLQSGRSCSRRRQPRGGFVLPVLYHEMSLYSITMQ